MMAERHYVVGISGASGAIYGCRLVEALLADPARHVHLTVTAAGARVMRDEMDPIAGRGGKARKSGADLGLAGDYLRLAPGQEKRLHAHACADIGAAPASGTFRAEAMIVAPCSMNTLAAISHGIEQNLLTRAAAVTLKEGRPLVLVPREAPLGIIELRNMTAAAEAGAIIIPASPGFYHRPESIEDLVGFVVQKVLDRLGIEMSGAFRWSGKAPGKNPKPK
jgi:4-hydroxy-3-polyprenylbenzoate decarboxylase